MAVFSPVQEIRHAFRRLARDWRFTVAAVAILGLGIGANTAMFTLVNATLFTGQAIANPDRLVEIYQNGVNRDGIDAVSYPAYLDMAAYTDVFAATTAATIPIGVSYERDGLIRPAIAQYTTASYLPVLGLQPSLGRWFDAAEDTRGAAVVAVLGHQAWTRKFHADPSVIGRTIRIEGVPITIVGVGPAGHNGSINVGIVTDFWLPIQAMPALGAPPGALERRPDEAAFFVKARLRDGVTVAQAQAAMRVLGTRLAAEYPQSDPGKGIAVFASKDVRVHPQLDAPLRWTASVLLGVVGLVLAIACSNLATLLLVRGASRSKEVAVRLALGATRGHLVRHLLTESVLLSAAGGAIGCLMAWWGIRAVRLIELPVAVSLSLDGRVLAFAAGLSLATGVAFGLAPALRATRVDLVPALHAIGATGSSDRRWFTLKNALVAFQVAVSVVLLGSASIFLQMLSASRSQHVGFAVDGVAMLETDTRYAGYSAVGARTAIEEIRRRVAAIPGVRSAVLARGLPMQTTGTAVIVPDMNGATAASDVASSAGGIWAGPGYFDLLRIPILYGRAIDERDRRETARVAVINEALARKSFGTVNAVGRRFRFDKNDTWLEVVGVVPDTGTADLAGQLVDPTPYLLYQPFAQSDLPPTTVLARTSLDAAALAGAMQRELRGVNVTLPVVTATTMAQRLEDSLAAPKAVAAILGTLGALGLCLAAIGLYAVIAFAVTQRRKEIGIRMALGARRRQVVWTVARDVAALVGVGTAMGLMLSVFATLALRAAATPAVGISLFRPAIDPAALLAIAAFMAMVGSAAAYLPARRAARMDPLAALRHD